MLDKLFLCLSLEASLPTTAISAQLPLSIAWAKSLKKMVRVDTPMGTHFYQFLSLIDRHSRSNLDLYSLHALLYQERFEFTLFIIKFEQIVMA